MKIEISTKQVGQILIMIAFTMVGIVSLFTALVASGAIPPLQLQGFDIVGNAILGITVQIAMYALLIACAVAIGNFGHKLTTQ